MPKEGDSITDLSASNITQQDKPFTSSFKSGSLDYQDDTIDPRVQVELEKLNTATDLINKLEIELDEARANFRLLLTESSQRINQQAIKLGSCIHKARPYYEARMLTKELQQETQKAALRFERASSAHAAAKEMVRLSEEGLCTEGRTFDPAWQEMLNHSTVKVNEAEHERRLSKALHQRASQSYNAAEQNVQHLHMQFKKAIAKSSLSARRSLLQLNNLSNQHQLQLLPYFEMKAQFNQLLEEQKRKVHNFEENVTKVKLGYSETLHNLERISDEIHMKRKQREVADFLGQRTEGVGAEDPTPLFNGTPSHHPRFSAPTTPSSPPPSPSYESTLREMQENSSPEEKKNITETLLKPEDFAVQSAKKPLPKDSREEIVCGLNCNQQDVTEPLNELPAGQEDTVQNSLSLPHLESAPTIMSGMLAPVARGDEMSDTESLASTDTADTLDDHQIECLLLDRVLELDYQDLINTTVDTASSSPH